MQDTCLFVYIRSDEVTISRSKPKQLLYSGTETRMLLVVAFKVAILALVCSSLCGAIIFRKSFSFAISRSNKRQKNNNAVPTWNLHADYSADESCTNAYSAISKSKQIVTFRLHNRTAVAYVHAASPDARLLQESLGCKPLYTLLPSNDCDASGVSQQYMLLTGVAGDCRSTVRFLKQVALNHTFDFAIPPSGELLANKLSVYLQEQRRGRPLAVHAFIISSGKGLVRRESVMDMATPSIFEVSATGSVTSVRGGTIGGAHIEKRRQYLESNYKDNMTEEECNDLLSKLFNPQMGDSEGGDSLYESGSSYRYVEIFDNWDAP